MRALKELEIGLMFWAGAEPAETLRPIKALGLRCGQLGIPASLRLDAATTAAWKRALADEDILVTTVFAAYTGENYADIPTARCTTGFVPPATRLAREERTYGVSDMAAALGVSSIACHIGFVPGDPSHPDAAAVRDLVRRVCDYAAQLNQTFALETGQESASVLMRFIRDVDRLNLRVNFDSANMVLYGTGDPIAALDVLGPLVVSVHVKDGNPPPHDPPGALGTQTPLGAGSVGLERFVAKLKDIGYTGALNIELESGPAEQRYETLRDAVAFLERLLV
jgi:sugar phosphate isomerase/epimerase